MLRNYPLIIQCEAPEVEVDISGGVGAVPIRFEGLSAATGYTLYQIIDGQRVPFDQSVHGNDFWQTDYDAKTQAYRRTYNLPLDDVTESKWFLSKDSLQ